MIFFFKRKACRYLGESLSLGGFTVAVSLSSRERVEQVFALGKKYFKILLRSFFVGIIASGQVVGWVLCCRASRNSAKLQVISPDSHENDAFSFSSPFESQVQRVESLQQLDQSARQLRRECSGPELFSVPA